MQEFALIHLLFWGEKNNWNVGDEGHYHSFVLQLRTRKHGIAPSLPPYKRPASACMSVFLNFPFSISEPFTSP
jgi:hypothetical protein